MTSEYRWEEILDAVEAVFAGPFNWEAERVMLAVLRFDGRLRLSESSELPHSMPPEDMLKSFAIQWLAKETGLTHLLEMQRVEATTASPVLASLVRAAIRGAAPPKLPTSELAIVAEVRPSPRRELIRGPLGWSIGQRPAKVLLPQGRQKEAVNKAVVHDLYTRYDVPLTPLRKKNVVNKAVILEHGLTFIPGHRGRRRRAEEVLAFA